MDKTERNRRAKISAAHIRHGHTSQHGPPSPTYQSWRAMRARCSQPTHRDWKNYGGRGIIVCPRWNSFANFLADMGTRPDGTQLDRRDNAGNYEPSNCRWATPTVQARNRRPRTIRSMSPKAIYSRAYRRRIA